MPVQLKEPELEIPCENNDIIKLHFEDEADGQEGKTFSEEKNLET